MATTPAPQVNPSTPYDPTAALGLYGQSGAATPTSGLAPWTDVNGKRPTLPGMDFVFNNPISGLQNVAPIPTYGPVKDAEGRWAAPKGTTPLQAGSPVADANNGLAAQGGSADKDLDANRWTAPKGTLPLEKTVTPNPQVDPTPDAGLYVHNPILDPSKIMQNPIPAPAKAPAPAPAPAAKK